MRRVPSGPMALPGNGRTNCATHVRTSTRSQTDNSLMRPGEIYLAQFPFGDVPGMKLRPVLLLTGQMKSQRPVMPRTMTPTFCAGFRSFVPDCAAQTGD